MFAVAVRVTEELVLDTPVREDLIKRVTCEEFADKHELPLESVNCSIKSWQLDTDLMIVSALCEMEISKTDAD